MKENAIITIKSQILTDEEKDVIDITTTGNFYSKDNEYFISYQESEATGFEGYTTTMSARGNSGVSITRAGEFSSTLLIEKNSVNICNYPSKYGHIVLDINGININNSLNEKGGHLEFEYSLNTSGMLLSENKVSVNIKEI